MRRIGVLALCIVFFVLPFALKEIPLTTFQMSAPDPQFMTAGETMLLQHGSVRYDGGGSYVYSTVLGEYNTYDSGSYHRYIYDDGGHSVDFAGHTLTLYDWYATFENESQILVDDMRWEVQYWRTQGGGSWRVLDLWEHLWLPVTEGNYLKFGQHYTDGFSELDVWYQVRNYDQMKITLNFTAFEARTYRFVWSLAGIDGSPITLGEAVEFGQVRVGWGDADLNASYEWNAGEKKCDVIFDSLLLSAGESYVLDPDVSDDVVDADDDWWHGDGSGWDHKTTDDEIYVLGMTPDYLYHGQLRFVLAIPNSATINSANVSVYENLDQNPADPTIWRINEDNVGPLESDTTFPERANTTTCSITADGVANEWEVGNVTDLVQEQVNLVGWSSGNGMGLRFGHIGTVNQHVRYDDVTMAGTNHAFINVSYTVGGGNNAPSNDGCTLTDPDDTDNLYAVYKDYTFTSNVSDADGFADIDYIEMSCYSGSAYWTVRYDEDTDTFSEEAGASYITLQVASSATESGNDIDVTWEIQIEWAHGDLTNYDLRQYVVDDEPESDQDDYDVNYDYETRVDITTGPTLSDGSGTADRGDYNQIDSITASGTVDYYGSAISPDSGDVDVWISCGDVVGSPWSDLTLSAGAFSVTVDSDDVVGLDSYSFKVVAEGGGSGGADLCHAGHTDTYIADRMVVTITADDTSVINGTQVNFTLSIVYDYDDAAVSNWVINVTNDAVAWYNFNAGNASICNDTDADTTNVYTASDCWNETTHGMTEFMSNTESVTWSAAGATTTAGAGVTRTVYYVTPLLFVQVLMICVGIGTACLFFGVKIKVG